MSAVTFGDLLDRARGHLDAAVGLAGIAQPSESVVAAAWLTGRLALNLSRYLDDIAPYTVAEAIIRTDLERTARAAVDAREAMTMAADAGPLRHSDHVPRVAARDHHAGLGGQGQPVTAAPAQRGDDGPAGDPAGGIDAAETVDGIRPARRAGQRHRTARPRLAVTKAAAAGGGNDRGDGPRGHGRLPDKRRLRGREPGRPLWLAARCVFKRCLFGEISPVWVSEGGLEPPCPFGALAPQASASAYSATRTSACHG
jgi:hypothetical protein